MQRLVADNRSTVTSILTCILLMLVTNRVVHYFVLPLVPITIARDTLMIDYLMRELTSVRC